MKINLTLIGILVVGFFLRFTDLNSVPPSLFSDEVDIGYQVKSLLSTGRDYYGNLLPLQFHSFSDTRTSLPIYATALVSTIPGVTIDLAIRLTPAIFSILSILTVFFLTNNIFKIFKLNTEKESSTESGLWASLTLTVLPWHFTYSRTGFELSMLFFFFVFGLFLYTKYILGGKTKHLVISLIVLSFAPMIYSTAKLSVFFYPLVLLLIPGGIQKLENRKSYLFLSILFIPMLILFINGGAGKRFNEISIFTDPTISTETDFSRKVDLGPNAAVGSSPSISTKIVHNKIVYVSDRFIKNIIYPFSASYLFLQGDTNPRHAVQGFGMLEKVLIAPILIGLYTLASQKQKRLLALLAVLFASAVLPSALTRDGWNHSSRMFMMILPILIVSVIGINSLRRFSAPLTLLFVTILVFESFTYLHTYLLHFPYDSERDWHTGMKEVVQIAKTNSTKTVIISNRYEPPLIFFLYYSDFPPQRFQQLARENSFLREPDKSLNLEGSRFADTNVYFATIDKTDTKNPFMVKGGLYLLTRPDLVDIYGSGFIFPSAAVSLPSGEGLFYSLLPKP